MKTKNYSNQELLEKYSPIIKLTKGEIYKPSKIDDYIKHSSLIAHLPSGDKKTLIKKNNLKLSDLSKNYNLPTGSITYLKLTEEQDLIKSIRTISKTNYYKNNPDNKFSHTQGRLARVGFISRFFDAIFSLTFLLRGTVPGLASAQAANYFLNDSKSNNATAYGRIIRDESGWICLQYWFFYYFNDWRSNFYGVNDHESDWEMATVYLYEDKNNLKPEWVAYASHDFHGDDLRRRFDDKNELETIDSHPIIYAGAGSHASYFIKGEYLSNFPIPIPRLLKKPAEFINDLWNKYFDFDKSFKFTIPFIDYARGDGKAYGHKQKNKLNIIEISDKTDWVNNYRGLWGYFAQDPVSGENAPAGPKYNRDQSIRTSWSDPLAFSGLDKVPTPPNKIKFIKIQININNKEIKSLRSEIKTIKNNLILLNLQRQSVEKNINSENIINDIELKIKNLDNKLKHNLNQLNFYLSIGHSLDLELKKSLKGIKDDPTFHIKNLAKPQDPKIIKHARLTEIWAALSISLILFCLVAILILFPRYLIIGIIVTLYLFSLFESILRGTYNTTIIWIALTLSILSLLIVIINFWVYMVLILIFLSATYLILDNFRELRN